MICHMSPTLTVALYYGLDIYQIKLGPVQVNPKSVQKMSNVQLLFRIALETTHQFYILCYCIN